MITAAFPILERGGNGLDLTDPGMTHRDYFAGQVIGAAFSDLFIGWRTRGEPVVEDWPIGLAIDARRADHRQSYLSWATLRMPDCRYSDCDDRLHHEHGVSTP